MIQPGRRLDLAPPAPYRLKLLRGTRASIGAARWLDRSVLMISSILQSDKSSGQRHIEVCGPCGCRFQVGESADGREEETVGTNLLTSAASLTVTSEVGKRSMKPQQAGEGRVDGSGRSRPARWTAPGRPSAIAPDKHAPTVPPYTPSIYACTGFRCR